MKITNHLSQNVPTNLFSTKIGEEVESIVRDDIVLTDNVTSLERKNDYKQLQKIEEDANKLFDSLNTGLALKFHEASGEWYAVIENKLTREVVKEVPPRYVLDLQAKLKEMVGIFLDKKI